MSTVITKRKLEEAVSALDVSCSPFPAKQSAATSPPTTNAPECERTPTRLPTRATVATSCTPTATAYNGIFPASPNTTNAEKLTGEKNSPESVKRPQYRPWDRQDFLQRLETYQISTWFGKPEALNAAECTQRGWHNVGMEKLACRQCNAELNMRGVEKESLASKYVKLLNEAHKDSCPWKNRPCSDSIYTISFVSSLATLSEYRERAQGLITMFRNANRVPKVESELTLDEIVSLTNALSTSQSPPSTRAPSAPSSPSIIPPPSSPSSRTDAVSAPTELESESTALQTSPPDDDRNESSVTRAACILAVFGWQAAGAIRGKVLVKCGMCHRTIGLWMFEQENIEEGINDSPTESHSSENALLSETMSSPPSRALNALHEHRSYCPWIKEPKNANPTGSSTLPPTSYSSVSPPLSVGACGVAAETIGWKRTRAIVMRAVKSKGTSTFTNDRPKLRSGPEMSRKTYDVLAQVRNILGPKRRKKE